MDMPQFVPSVLDGLLSIVTNVAMNMGVQILLQDLTFSCFDSYSEVELLYMVFLFLTFEELSFCFL
jgi:hypothetical protein